MKREGTNSSFAAAALKDDKIAVKLRPTRPGMQALLTVGSTDARQRRKSALKHWQTASEKTRCKH